MTQTGSKYQVEVICSTAFVLYLGSAIT